MANDRQQQQVQKYNPLVPTAPRIPYPPQAEQYGCDESLWRALIDGVWPGAQSADGVLLALSWCKWRKLDPIKRPCHIVAIWSSKLGRNVESVWPSIGEVRITAFRTGQYAGIDDAEWGPIQQNRTFKGKVRGYRDGNTVYENKECTLSFPSWCRMTVYRMVQGQRVKFVGPKVHFLAAYGAVQDTELPNDKWQEPGYYMLEKCAEAAALRRAFPEEMGDMVTAEEMEGRRYETQMDMGGGTTVETPVDQPQRPNKSEARFQDAPRQAPLDVDGQGAVQQPSTQERTQQAPKPEKQAQQQKKEPPKKPVQQAQEPPRQEPLPEAPAAGAEPPYEPGQDDGQDPTYTVYDEVGEATEGLLQMQYIDRLSKLFIAAPSEKALTTLYDNNIGVLDAFAEEVKRPVFKTYSDRMTAIREEARQAAAAQAAAQPAAQDHTGVAKFSLFDHSGNPYARNLMISEFLNGIDTLFKKAQDRGRLEAIYRYNAKTIQMFPKSTQDAILRIYDARHKSLANTQDAAGGGDLLNQ